MYSVDLNTKLVQYSDHGVCSIVDWFALQMPSTMVVQYSDHIWLMDQLSDYYSNTGLLLITQNTNSTVLTNENGEERVTLF